MTTIACPDAAVRSQVESAVPIVTMPSTLRVGRTECTLQPVHVLVLLTLLVLATACRRAPTRTVAPQQPSPMRETTRAHTRLVDGEDPGIRLRIDSILPAPVEVFLPQRVFGQREVPLLLHFMGATWVPRRAVAYIPEPVVVAAVHLGAGSRINAAAFAGDSTRFPRLVAAIEKVVRDTPGAPALRGTYLSAWSAGYGAIREVLKHTSNAGRLDGILLLDGLHAGYRPDGVPLAAGGAIDSTDLLPFVPFAREAAQGRRRLVITHSEIFPGTFASTTETTDWLLERFGMRRTAVLEWGPMGSQVLSRSVLGGIEVIGMAGNTAPDHVDHFHGMAPFVARLLGIPESPGQRRRQKLPPSLPPEAA